MATVTERAEFGGNNSYLSSTNNHSEADGTYPYLSVDSVKNDATFVEQARENLKYQFYTFANTVALNVVTIRVMPWWEAALISVIVVSAVVGAAATGLWITSNFLKNKKEEEN